MDRGAEWQVLLSPGVLKGLSRMTPEDRERVLGEIRGLTGGPFHSDVARLHGRPEWRLRVGPYRVLLRVDVDGKTIVVTGIGSRGDVYKD